MQREARLSLAARLLAQGMREREALTKVGLSPGVHLSIVRLTGLEPAAAYAEAQQKYCSALLQPADQTIGIVREQEEWLLLLSNAPAVAVAVW